MKCGNVVISIELVIDASLGNYRLMDSDVRGGESKRPVSAMTVGGDTNEVVEGDDASVVSNDGGDEEINPNGNLWPRSGVQSQSYYRKLSIWKNVIRDDGQIFQSDEAFWQMLC